MVNLSLICPRHAPTAVTGCSRMQTQSLVMETPSAAVAPTGRDQRGHVSHSNRTGCGRDAGTSLGFGHGLGNRLGVRGEQALRYDYNLSRAKR